MTGAKPHKDHITTGQPVNRPSDSYRDRPEVFNLFPTTFFLFFNFGKRTLHTFASPQTNQSVQKSTIVNKQLALQFYTKL